MQNKDQEKVELDGCPDFDQVIESLENLYNSLDLSDEEMDQISCDTHETFEDVKFELLPSFDENGMPVTLTRNAPDEKSKDNPYTLAFTLSEKDIISFHRIQEVINPILFRFALDGSLWLVEHHEESFFRFSHYSEEEILASFTIPKGSEKFCIGYPGGIIIDRNNNLYILDVIQQTVHKFSSEGEYDSAFQDLLSSFDSFSDLRDFDIAEEEQQLLLTDFVKGSVIKISLQGGQVAEILLREGESSLRLKNVTGIAAMPDGQYFVVDPFEKRIMKISNKDVRLEVYPMAQDQGYNLPFCSQIYAHIAGFIFLVDLESQIMHLYNLSGALKGIFHAGPQSLTPEICFGCLDVSKEGKVFFINRLTGNVHCLHYHF